MIVRDDDPFARPDEAGAEGLRGVAAVASAEDAERIEERIDFAAADRRFGLDVDDGRPDIVRDGDDRRAPRGADGGRNRRAFLPRLARVDSLRFRGRLAGKADQKNDEKETKLHAGIIRAETGEVRSKKHLNHKGTKDAKRTPLRSLCLCGSNAFLSALLSHLRPRILQRHRAVEDEILFGRIGIDAEVAEAFELVVGEGSGAAD